MTAFVVLTSGGAALARRLAADVPGGEIHGPPALAAEVDCVFERAIIAIADLFAQGRPVIGICAAGILIRAVAPLLSDKRLEPPLLALAEDGSAIVPLLGGHHGGNALARFLGERLGILPAITTAGDLALGVALDEPPPGWRLADPAAAKAVTASLLAGGAVRLDGDLPWLSRLRQAPDAPHLLRASIRPATPDAALTFHPGTLALGAGCERGADAEELIALAEAALHESGLVSQAIACVVSLDLKTDEPAMHALGRHFGVPVRFFPASRLIEETPRLATPSEAVFRETGCWGVAEGAALAAVGAEGRLLAPKRKSARATIAIAEAPAPLDPPRIGQAQGRLTIIGIGPGTSEWRTPEASAAIAEADHLVGYGLYLDLLGSLTQGKTRHETGLGHEESRARTALDLAAAGHRVALISSGDAGIYGLATLAFELVERGDHPGWRRVALSVAPGISALQAAAARAGAPLGHDFCAISLSDLLTPRDVILARLHAAASGDFVTALYNPRSERRRDLLAAARAIFLAHRPPTTPVLLARNLGRPGEAVTITDLAGLDPDAVDMLTLVMIGAAATRRISGADWVYTPRGYAQKRDIS